MEHVFRVYIASPEHEEVWENFQIRDVIEGLHHFLEFSQNSECLDEAIQTRKSTILL